MTEPLPLPLTVCRVFERVFFIVPKGGGHPVLQVDANGSMSDAHAIAVNVAARLNVHPDMAETLRMVVREYFGAPESHTAHQKFIAERSLEILRSMAECMPPDPEPQRIFSAFQTDRGREATPPFDDYIHPGGA